MTTCVEVYIEDDGTMSVAVEQDVQPSPEESAEQKQQVESIEQVMQIIQAVAQSGGGQSQEPAPDENAAMDQGFSGVRGGGL